MSKAYKTDTTIDGIMCEVASCDFHTPEDKCSANCIKVGKTKKEGSPMADCETFCPKSDCCK